jgi:hypothetical protein
MAKDLLVLALPPIMRRTAADPEGDFRWLPSRTSAKRSPTMAHSSAATAWRAPSTASTTKAPECCPVSPPRAATGRDERHQGGLRRNQIWYEAGRIDDMKTVVVLVRVLQGEGDHIVPVAISALGD